MTQRVMLLMGNPLSSGFRFRQPLTADGPGKGERLDARIGASSLGSYRFLFFGLDLKQNALWP